MPNHMDESNDQRATDKAERRLALSRRGFLAAAVGGLVATGLQACGRASPSPPAPLTPTTALPAATPSLAPSATAPPSAVPTASPLGTQAVHLPVVGVAEPSATPSITPSSTVTPTPAPTATPFPTVTPRPLATPFPPGPPSKLGLFIGYQHPTLEALLRTGNVAFVKTLEYDPNLMEFIKQISPNTLIVARYTPLDQFDEESADPRAEARRFVDLLLPVALEPKRFAHIDAWEAHNEPVVSTPEAMRALAIFEAERTRLLAEAGVRSCVGNFATGTPPLELWPEFFPALQAVKETGGFLGLHEYSAPTMWFGTGVHQLEAGQDEGDEGWLTLRYRKVYRRYLQPAGLAVPLVITETGIDGGIVQRPGPVGFGWQDFEGFWEAEGLVRTTAAGFYMEQLAWYDAELAQDPYVRGASIYALAAPVGWHSFEINGALSDLLQGYLAVHPRRGG